MFVGEKHRGLRYQKDHLEIVAFVVMLIYGPKYFRFPPDMKLFHFSDSVIESLSRKFLDLDVEELPEIAEPFD